MKTVGRHDVRKRARRWAIAMTLAVVVTASAFPLLSSDEPQFIPVGPLPTEDRTSDEILRDLVNRGLVPEQALDNHVPSREEITRDLVNRGLVPRPTID